MRILYLAGDPVPSFKGAGVRIRRTVDALLALGHEVRLLTPASASGERLDHLPHDTVPLPQRNYLERMLAFRQATHEWISGQEADLVQFRGIWEGLPAAAWARRRGVPIVFEAHGLPSIELPYHHPGLDTSAGLLEKIIAEEHALLGQADSLITPSRTGRRYLMMRGVHPDRIHVLPNAVDTDLFSPDVAPPVDEPPLRVVYQGTMAPWQGLSYLLEALVPLRRAGVVELHVVGPMKSAWRRQIRSLARRLRVHHLLRLSPATEQRNLVPVLRGAHVCVAPMPADARNAVQGCCPIKILEYMATGRPILATRISPLVEILEHERDAWLVRPGSAAALTDGLAWMMAHREERERLGARAREQACARWTGHLFASRLEPILALIEEAHGVALS